MSKYTFEIYETWKIEESFEADSLEDKTMPSASKVSTILVFLFIKIHF